MLLGLYSKAVSFNVNLAKKHCHCHASTLIPDNEEHTHAVDIDSNLFHVGETLLYTNAGHTTYVKVEKIYIYISMMIRSFASNVKLLVMKRSLQLRNLCVLLTHQMLDGSQPTYRKRNKLQQNQMPRILKRLAIQYNSLPCRKNSLPCTRDYGTYLFQ